jgi:hypothetical protein
MDATDTFQVVGIVVSAGLGIVARRHIIVTSSRQRQFEEAGRHQAISISNGTSSRKPDPVVAGNLS